MYCHKQCDLFDPTLHETLMASVNLTKPAGSIGLVMKKCYKLNGRVLSPEEVGVITVWAVKVRKHVPERQIGCDIVDLGTRMRISGPKKSCVNNDFRKEESSLHGRWYRVDDKRELHALSKELWIS
jgi:GrpE